MSETPDRMPGAEWSTPAAPALPDLVAGTAAGSAWLRLERGCPTPEELAALTVVLATLNAGADFGPDDMARRRRVGARWRRPERMTRAAGPRSWRSAV
ncbi:acyl-CoA carboxylase epsilon subunit [Streptomyces sp. NPDC091271]|uniref:acyl-CoA carboxylase epsilon subunit n=1 Tax=Streptomyces sp. NPDC091271 TaxID=3365980 RepID=UPI00380457AE